MRGGSDKSKRGNDEGTRGASEKQVRGVSALEKDVVDCIYRVAGERNLHTFVHSLLFSLSLSLFLHCMLPESMHEGAKESRKVAM